MTAAWKHSFIFVLYTKSIQMIVFRPYYRSSLLFVLLFLFSKNLLFANVTLPYFFSDNMVLQLQTDAAIWGWAKACSNVQITTYWNKKNNTVKADATGKWKAKVNTPAAGGPYQIGITDGTPLLLQNILIGEVWLCNGQSNMEMPMKGFRDQPVLGSNDDIFNAANNNIRIYVVPRSVKMQPQDTSKNSSWKIAAPEAINNFSATAYYFARILQQQLKVPVGVVNILHRSSFPQEKLSE